MPNFLDKFFASKDLSLEIINFSFLKTAKKLTFLLIISFGRGVRAAIKIPTIIGKNPKNLRFFFQTQNRTCPKIINKKAELGMFLILKLENFKFATNSDRFSNFCTKYPKISNGKNSKPVGIAKRDIKLRGKIIKLTKGMPIRLAKIP